MKPLLVALCLCAAAAGCRQSPRDHLRRARDLVFEKKPEAALDAYLQAIEALRNDHSTEAAVYRARALRGAADVYYLELGRLKDAVAVYRQLLEQCPEAPEALDGRVHLAEILRSHYKDLRGAITELTAALARNPPQSAELNYQVAKLYFELADYRQAELEARAVVKKFETSAYVDDALFLVAQSLGMVEERRAEAIRAFQELVDRFPDSDLQPHALFELAKARADLRDDEKAIELWVKALKRHPDPALVQSHIERVRARITQTTPARIGDHRAAFDQGPVVAQLPMMPKEPPRSSVEAAGGTAQEAAEEASRMQAE